jgi:hypothetical protein
MHSFKITCVLAAFGLALPAAAGVQQIRTEPIIQSVAPGEVIEFEVLYATEPATPALTGLGLRVHWDTDVLELIDFQPLVEDGFLGQSDAPMVDELDFDTDAVTDRFVVLAWAEQQAGWPGFADGAIARFTFAVSDDFVGGTPIGISSSSTPAGWTLSDIPGLITDPEVGVPAPELAISKTWQAPGGVAGIGFGDSAFFEIEVTNPGLVALENLQIVDALVPDCDRDFDRFLAGDSEFWICEAEDVVSTFVNEIAAEAIALDGLETPVIASDTAEVVVLDPLIGIEIDPASQMVRFGDAAGFEITVTNDSGQVLEGVELASAAVPDCGLALQPMAPGESLVYSCQRESVEASFDNVITATAPFGDPPEATVLNQVTAEVIQTNPALALAITIEPNPAEIGTPVSLNFQLANSGDTALADVEILVPQLPNCENAFSSLAAGASLSWSCSLQAPEDDLLVNATATGQPPVGDTVTAEDQVLLETYILILRDGFEDES